MASVVVSDTTIKILCSISIFALEFIYLDRELSSCTSTGNCALLRRRLCRTQRESLAKDSLSRSSLLEIMLHKCLSESYIRRRPTLVSPVFNEMFDL